MSQLMAISTPAPIEPFHRGSISLGGRDDARKTVDIPECVLLLTLLLLLLYGGTDWKLDIPLKVACCAGIVLPAARRSVLLWTALTGLIGFINGQTWHSIDNHKYLITYWSMCVTMSVAWPRMGSWILAANARGLIGACFGFAVLWKFVAGQYLDGSFLHHTFLTDPRVQVPAALAGSMPLSDLAANRYLEGYLTSWPYEHPVVHLASTNRLEDAAVLLSYWTLLIESLVALLWLFPFPRTVVFKHAALMIFVLTTYGVLPVVGFATILGVMGFAAATISGRRTLSGVWLGVIGAAQCASVPWGGYVAEYLR
jgi:hypothetical protein